MGGRLIAMSTCTYHNRTMERLHASIVHRERNQNQHYYDVNAVLVRQHSALCRLDLPDSV